MKDEWVAAALEDDDMVVELLFRLKQSSSSEFYASSLPPNPPPPLTPVLVPKGWGNRQLRSRLVNGARKEREPTTRCSPTTPLSWSGGGGSGSAASPSDGYDESSRPSDRSSSGRSKGAFTNEIFISTAHKRSKKKKTFAELKEEESLLLKERVHLKRELASLCVTLKEQRARSENLKRLKLDLNLQSANKTGAASDDTGPASSNHFNNMEPSTLDDARPILPRHPSNDDLASSDSCRAPKDIGMQERCIILPDLNMIPSEEENWL